jgi:hypothetical protein
MTYPLLLDEMFSAALAEQLQSRGHDVQAVAGNPATMGLPDEQILLIAAEAGRALVTANIRDFQPLDAAFLAAGRRHAGLVFVSSKTFPQNRGRAWDVLQALLKLLDQELIGPNRVLFLQR